jgi:hypothetical protein
MKKILLKTIMYLAYASTLLQYLNLYLDQDINIKLIYTCLIIIALIYLIFNYIQYIVETNKLNSIDPSPSLTAKESSGTTNC